MLLIKFWRERFIRAATVALNPSSAVPHRHPRRREHGHCFKLVLLRRRARAQGAVRAPFGKPPVLMGLWEMTAPGLRGEGENALHTLLPLSLFPLWHHIKQHLIWYSVRFSMSSLSPCHPGWVWFLLRAHQSSSLQENKGFSVQLVFQQQLLA